MVKKYQFEEKELPQLIDHAGVCIASDRITVDGSGVCYMYRETPKNDEDSGWVFLAGDETEEYLYNPVNHGIYPLNTIANLDKDIITYLSAPVGSTFARESSLDAFIELEE